MEKIYTCRGTCSRSVRFEIASDKTLHGIRFNGGCNGNTQGVAALCEGMNADEAIKRLSGIRCGGKPTSCPDQLATAIKEALTEMSDNDKG